MNTHPTIQGATETQARIEGALAHGARAVMPEALAYALAHPDEGKPRITTRTGAERVGEHLCAALKGMHDMRRDVVSLNHLRSVLEEASAQSEDVGHHCYVAMQEIDRWIDHQLAECDYRRQNAVD